MRKRISKRRLADQLDRLRRDFARDAGSIAQAVRGKPFERWPDDIADAMDALAARAVHLSEALCDVIMAENDRRIYGGNAHA